MTWIQALEICCFARSEMWGRAQLRSVEILAEARHTFRKRWLFVSSPKVAVQAALIALFPPRATQQTFVILDEAEGVDLYPILMTDLLQVLDLPCCHAPSL